MLLVFLLLLPAVVSSAAIQLTYNVPEEEEAGYRIGNVARDADFMGLYNGNVPSELRFQLLKPSEYFSIHPTLSEISTTDVLDREAICQDSPDEPCKITIDVTVTPLHYFQMIKIHITIKDVNDNSPMFPKQIFSLQIPESAPVNTTFPLPTAQDRDSVDFGVSYYELEATTQVFSISTSNSQYGGMDLLLVLRQPLDRERQGAYTLKLVARDAGGMNSRSGMMLLNITVGDENDNSPVFQQPLYTVRVPESAEPGIMLTRVRAMDRDSGGNGLIKYMISPRTSRRIQNSFEMNAETGELFLKDRLDYERGDNYLIPIIAYDNGIISRSSQALVNVTVTDENDNFPTITVTTIPLGNNQAQVIEHSPNGTFVAHVLVVDADAGSNGDVTCVISSPYFTLQPSFRNEYNLVVNSALDREVESTLNVTIHCSDAGSPPRVSLQLLTVTIVDVNDQQPTFDRFVYYTMPILEGNEPGLSITTVKAMDRDTASNAIVRYYMGPEEAAQAFAVDPVSGLITAITSLDREKSKELTFSILAIDQGTPPLTATAAIYVRIADINDNPPKFNRSHYKMSVAENMPKYSFVGKVTATDADEGSNGNIWYRMLNASTGPFIIAHDTGIISTRVPLDRERVHQYQIVVVATDYGTPALSSEIRITIDITDENDHAPIITSADNMTITTSFQTPKNTTIGAVKAMDPDSGENSKLGFFIQKGNQYGLFSIDRNTGVIRMAKNVDASMTGYYRLEIGVQDNGLPPHTVFTRISITLTKDKYVPVASLIGKHPKVERNQPVTHNVNLVVVIVLSSMSGVLSLILIVAIIRIKRQTKENHSYNCRAEAQKLFANHSGHLNTSRAGSSWGGFSTADRSSVFSRDSVLADAEECKTFLTTFSSGTQKPQNHVMTALETFDKSNLEKRSNYEPQLRNLATQVPSQDSTKRSELDSGNCENDISVHNSTPMLSADLTQPKEPQSFQYRFMTAPHSVNGSKVPSSISSGNNSSLTTESSHAASSGSSLPNQNSAVNQQQVSPSTLDPHNSSIVSESTINGDRLMEKIDKMFFSEI